MKKKIPQGLCSPLTEVGSHTGFCFLSHGSAWPADPTQSQTWLLSILIKAILKQINTKRKETNDRKKKTAHISKIAQSLRFMDYVLQARPTICSVELRDFCFHVPADDASALSPSFYRSILIWQLKAYGYGSQQPTVTHTGLKSSHIIFYIYVVLFLSETSLNI